MRTQVQVYIIQQEPGVHFSGYNLYEISPNTGWTKPENTAYMELEVSIETDSTN